MELERPPVFILSDDESDEEPLPKIVRAPIMSDHDTDSDSDDDNIDEDLAEIVDKKVNVQRYYLENKYEKLGNNTDKDYDRNVNIYNNFKKNSTLKDKKSIVRDHSCVEIINAMTTIKDKYEFTQKDMTFFANFLSQQRYSNHIKTPVLLSLTKENIEKFINPLIDKIFGKFEPTKKQYEKLITMYDDPRYTDSYFASTYWVKVLTDRGIDLKDMPGYNLVPYDNLTKGGDNDKTLLSRYLSSLLCGERIEALANTIMDTTYDTFEEACASLISDNYCNHNDLLDVLYEYAMTNIERLSNANKYTTIHGVLCNRKAMNAIDVYVYFPIKKMHEIIINDKINDGINAKYDRVLFEYIVYYSSIDNKSSWENKSSWDKINNFVPKIYWNGPNMMKLSTPRYYEMLCGNSDRKITIAICKYQMTKDNAMYLATRNPTAINTSKNIKLEKKVIPEKKIMDDILKKYDKNFNVASSVCNDTLSAILKCDEYIEYNYKDIDIMISRILIKDADDNIVTIKCTGYGIITLPAEIYAIHKYIEKHGHVTSDMLNVVLALLSSNTYCSRMYHGLNNGVISNMISYKVGIDKNTAKCAMFALINNNIDDTGLDMLKSIGMVVSDDDIIWALNNNVRDNVYLHKSIKITYPILIKSSSLIKNIDLLKGKKEIDKRTSDVFKAAKYIQDVKNNADDVFQYIQKNNIEPDIIIVNALYYRFRNARSCDNYMLLSKVTKIKRIDFKDCVHYIMSMGIHDLTTPIIIDIVKNGMITNPYKFII